MSTNHSVTSSDGEAPGPTEGDPSDDIIRAAGCVVFRHGERGPEVLVVHRPRYDDWDLPKGKQEPGETAEECAVRETLEESGHEGELMGELAPDTYRVKGRDKQVRWFLMSAGGGTFEPNDEVDQARWLPLDEAREILSYGHARSLLDAVPVDVDRSSDGS